MRLSVDGFVNGELISPRFAFGDIPPEGHFTTSHNISPNLTWGDAPDLTRSFALILHDPDAPADATQANQEGKTLPKDLPRADFYHWVVANIPRHLSQIPEGADSRGVTAGGKTPGQQEFGHTGINSYTDWFKGDADMEGIYGGYDGPCPPWNDVVLHRYYLTLYALDQENLPLKPEFSGRELLAAMDGHILASAAQMGTYSMNPQIRGNYATR